MCGICFCFVISRKIPITFEFFPFLSYVENSYSNKNIKDFPYSDDIFSDYFYYITQNNLFIKDFNLNNIKNYMQSRGPDSFNILIQNDNKTISYLPNFFNTKPIFTNLSHNTDNSDYKTISAGSVLHLRGEINQPNNIPLFDYKKTKNVFLYNGEIYSLKKENVSRLPFILQSLGIKSFDVYKNDTNQLFEIFNNYSQIYKLQKEKIFNYEDNLVAISDCFHGDFSFIFYDYINNYLIIGKDIFGKKSLLLGFHKNGFCIGSCAASINENNLNQEEYEADQNDFEENGQNDQEFLQKKYLNEFLVSKNKEWLELPSQSITFVKINFEKEGFLKNIVFSNKKFPSSKVFSMPHYIQNEESKENISKNIEETVKKILLKSVKRILKNIIEFKPYFMKMNHDTILSKSHECCKNSVENKTGSQIAIMFSGGIDSALLAHLVNLILPINERYLFEILIKYVKTVFSIDLLNVSFDPTSPDRKTSIRSYNELKTLSPMRNYKLILIDKNLQDIEEQEKDLLEKIYPKMSHMDFNIATALKFASKGVGYLYEDPNQIQIMTNSKVILSGLGFLD